MTGRRRGKRVAAAVLRWVLPLLAGCAIVRPHEREHLTDPTFQDDALESASMRKLHRSREGAGGGEGIPAGGGCSCSN